jgi:uncharacterized damage-inducible protein DinB
MADPTPSPKQQFLNAYEHEHATTMKVLRAYPKDRIDLRPHASCRTARELAWVFVMEHGFGNVVLNDQFDKMDPAAGPPDAPKSWDEILGALEKAHTEFRDLVASFPDEQMNETVKMFTGPKMMGDVRRIDFCNFMLSDQIHHRGQFSIYLRMADAKVPSIYGPSGDEPWM